MASPEPLQPYRKVQSEAEKELTRILEQTARAIRTRVSGLPVGIGGDVRRAQLNSTLGAIKRMQRSMWTGGVVPLIVGGVDDAEKAAESAIETMTRVAYASLPDAAAESLVRGLRLSAESGLKSDKARKRRELSARVYRQASLNEGKVEDLIREGLIANLSAKELADSVYDHVSPTTKGGASYAAMRLARTEINNAFHERQLQGATRPGVTAAKWNLSGSHRVPDLCNVYASKGGKGEWPPDAIPDKPHPNCFCYLTYVTTPPEEFRKRLAAGSFDDEIDRRTRENMARMGQKVGKLEPAKVDAKAKPRRRDDPVYKKDYERGWKAAGRSNDLTAADKRGESDAFYDGFSDRSIGEPKWTAPDEKDELETKAKFDTTVPVAKTGDAAHDIVPKGLFKRGSMTPKERQELKTYEGGWFAVINGFLRGKRWGDPEYKRDEQTVRVIQGAMDGSSLPEAIQTWRGMFNAKSVFGDSWDSDLTGFEWDDLGFGSTTTEEKIARSLFTHKGSGLGSNNPRIEGDVVMKVVIPAGVKALQTSTSTKGSKVNGPQAEITLQDSLTWKVVRDNGFNPDGVREIEVQVNPIRPDDE